MKFLLKYAPNILVESRLGIIYCSAKMEDFVGTRCFFDSMIIVILRKLDQLHFDRIESSQSRI